MHFCRSSHTAFLATLISISISFAFVACDTGSIEREDDPPPVTGEDTAPAVGCEEDTAIELQVPPTATFLRVAPSDLTLPAPAYRLAELGAGLVPGTRIRVERLGEYQFRDIHPDSVRFGILAVFSSDATLLDRSERERVPGAIDAGDDFTSRPSFRDNAATDIPEDFAVFEEDTLVVPEGAEYIFVSPEDDSFEDNLDEDGDFRLCIVPLDN